MTENSQQPYWASVGAKDIANNILEKAEDYFEYLSQSGRLDLWRRSWTYYYRPRLSGGMLNPAGQQGELTALSVNHYRNLLVHLETMTVQQRPAFEPTATNSDVESQSQVILAAGLLDYYMSEKRVERKIKACVKQGLMSAEGFVRVEWDATAGKTYGVTPNGTPAYEGDVKYTNYAPENVIRDYTQNQHTTKDWVILRDFENKYDLAAKFPELQEKILNDSDDLQELMRTTVFNYRDLDESDNIAVYTLLHPLTPSMTRGRFTRVLQNGTILMDGPLPYDETHVYRLAPDEEMGTIFGYTVGFDLLPIQELIDMLYSTAASNNAAFAVQNILVPKGHDLSTSQLSGGLNVMEYDPNIGKPEAMQLLATSPETYQFIQMLEQLAETISGVNSVARGNPEASLKSGAALALVQSMAIQFSMNLQQSYAQLVEDVGTGTIKILQKYAAVPRVAAIAGKSNRPLMKSFTGQDLAQISRVKVEMGNPLTKTLAGRVNLADSYMEKGMVENPDQYVQVVNTGRLEPIIEGKQANLLLTKGENEKLADGVPQRALLTDNHAKHILEHSTVLANPEIRQDASNPIVQVTLAHIQEHMNLAMSPAYLQIAQMLGHQVVPQPMMAQPPADGGAGQMLDATTPAQQEAGAVEQPNMPNPPAGTDETSAAIIEAQKQGA